MGSKMESQMEAGFYRVFNKIVLRGLNHSVRVWGYARLYTYIGIAAVKP